MGVALAIVVGYLLGTFPSADLVTPASRRADGSTSARWAAATPGR